MSCMVVRNAYKISLSQLASATFTALSWVFDGRPEPAGVAPRGCGDEMVIFFAAALKCSQCCCSCASRRRSLPWYANIPESLHGPSCARPTKAVSSNWNTKVVFAESILYCPAQSFTLILSSGCSPDNRQSSPKDLLPGSRPW